MRQPRGASIDRFDACEEPLIASRFEHRVTLELLGCRLEVRCLHEACAAGVRAYFSTAVVARPWTTPDVIVECNWERADRFLFRSRPPEHADTPLPGVRVRAPAQAAAADWPSLDPPIPPMEVHPYANRFIALHAAAVRDRAARAVVLPGERGSGKTTCALRLVNDYGWALMSDENAFIHLRSAVLEPFVRSVGLRERPESGEKRMLPAQEACSRVAFEPAVATLLVFLKRDQGLGVEPLIESLAPAATLRHLLAHHLVVGSSPDEAMVTLVDIARRVSAFRFVYSTYDTLCELPSRVPELLGQAGKELDGTDPFPS